MICGPIAPVARPEKSTSPPKATSVHRMKRVFSCAYCGNEYLQPSGRCPTCGARKMREKQARRTRVSEPDTTVEAPDFDTVPSI